MDFCADSMAASISGKAASPLTSGWMRLPDTSGGVTSRLTTLASIFKCSAAAGFGSPRFSGLGRWKVPCTPSVMARRRTRLTPSARYSIGPNNGMNQMVAIQSVAARTSRLCSRTWLEASSTASRSNPAARCGQNWESVSSQAIVQSLLREAPPDASLTR